MCNFVAEWVTVEFVVAGSSFALFFRSRSVSLSFTQEIPIRFKGESEKPSKEISFGEGAEWTKKDSFTQEILIQFKGESGEPSKEINFGEGRFGEMFRPFIWLHFFTIVGGRCIVLRSREHKNGCVPVMMKF